jgi:hypothetical protein
VEPFASSAHRLPDLPVRLFLVSACALAIGCAKPDPPTITPEKVVVTHIDMAGIALELTMSAANPNSVDLTASDVTSHLVIDKTRDLGTVALPKSTTLLAGKATEIDVPLTLNWGDMGVLAELATRTGAVPYTVDGTLELGGSLLHVGVPFHLDGAITRDQIVAATMNSLPLGK